MTIALKPMAGFERQALRAAWRAKPLWAAQFLINAALAAVAYGWLRIPDARGWQLLLTAVVAAVAVLVFLWLHATTLAYFHDEHDGATGVMAAIRTGLRHIPALLLVLIFFVGLEWLVSQAQPYVPQTAGYLQHGLPRAARARSTPQAVLGIGQWLVWTAQYVLLPLLLLPVASIAAARGFGGLRATPWLRRALHWRWLIWFVVALAAGWFLPTYLANRVVRVHGIAAQTASLAVRLLMAYALAITMWLGVASALGRLFAPDEQAGSAANGASAG